jgi:hypothetical protein
LGGSLSTDNDFTLDSFPIDLALISVTIDEVYAEVRLAF